MAKYTMLFAEYLANGGALPSSFALIEGFENLFIGEYCDHEIGFETDELFKIKLEHKANLLIPIYEEHIRLRAEYWTRASNPTKVRYEKATTQYNMGEQQISTTELPLDSETATPNVINKTNSYINDDVKELRHEENGETLDEVIKMINFLNNDVNELIQKLLKEFKPLFMGVY